MRIPLLHPVGSLRRDASVAILPWIVIAVLLAIQGTASAQTEFEVAFQVHRVESIQKTDAFFEDDMYVRLFVEGVGGGSASSLGCSFERYVQRNTAVVEPEWTCTMHVTGTDPVVSYRLELWDKDGNFLDPDDDLIDIDPSNGRITTSVTFWPASQEVSVGGGPTVCSTRNTRAGDAGDRAQIEFTVTSAIVGAFDGDSDGDGLLDTWETCGLPTVSLDAMGADPMRKDLFVEIDWMVDDDGLMDADGDDHSHEPPLSSLVWAWNEMRISALTNPDGSNGVDLHIDVGDLYENWAVDLDSDGVAEINVGDCSTTGPILDFDLDGDSTCESIDLDADGIADIGDLAGEGQGSRIPEQFLLSPGCDDLQTIEDANFSDDRNGLFRYGVWAHRHSDMRGSSGLACTQRTHMVSLGSWADRRQRRAPGSSTMTPPPLMATPSGLRGEGSISDHAGTFLHEIGHTMGLGHGGRDSVNWKPNYLSIMNYHFQIRGLAFDPNGDGRADTLTGVDFDLDGLSDMVRLQYSSATARIALDEGNLDETVGVTDPMASGLQQSIMTLTAPYPADSGGGPTTNAMTCASNCTMLSVESPPYRQWVPANGPIDWDRDGTPLDVGVSQLGGTYPPGNPTDLNADGSIDTLTTSSDVQRLQNGGLSPRTTAAVVSPGVSREAEQEALPTLVGAVPVPDRGTLESDCASGFVVDFEKEPIGTVLSTQFSPHVVFPVDATNEVKVEGDGERGGLPTETPTQSVVNAAAVGNDAPPMRIAFDVPARMVGVHVGVIEPGSLPSDQVVMRLYDEDDLLMGIVRAPLPAFGVGITGFIGAGAVLPLRPIARAEIDYEGSAAAILSPVRVDDLLVCNAQTESPTPYPEPPPPAYGDPEVELAFQAVLLDQEEVDDGSGDFYELFATPLLGVDVEVDGNLLSTDATYVTKEAAKTSIAAVEDLTNAAFLRWELEYAVGGVTVLHPEQATALDTTSLRSGIWTAVYVVDGDDDEAPDLAAGEFHDNCLNLPNPLQEDLDGDDLGDPCDDDRDGDGIDNVFETGGGVYVSPTNTGTNPDLADTDGDGLLDGDEVANGTNPNDPNDPPLAAMVPGLGVGASLLSGVGLLLTGAWALRNRRMV